MSYRFSLSFVAKQARFGAYALVACLGVTTGFGVVFGGTGCGGELGGECILDGDCDEKLICAYQFCHVPCTKTVDCTKTDPAAECIIGHEGGKAPYNYCARPTPCEKDVECGDGRVCAADGKCREGCITDSGCLGDQLCSGGYCHSMFAEAPVQAEVGKLCGVHSDCVSQNCISQVCNGCLNDDDCANGGPCDNTCDNGVGRCGSCDMGAGGAGGMAGGGGMGGASGSSSSSGAGGDGGMGSASSSSISSSSGTGGGMGSASNSSSSSSSGAGGMGSASSSSSSSGDGGMGSSSSSSGTGGDGGMGSASSSSSGSGGGMSGACPNDTFDATVTPIPLNGYTVIDATPNANGTAIYFTALTQSGNSFGIFKVDAQGGVPEAICDGVGGRIQINSNDSTLFVIYGGIWTLGTAPGTCVSNNYMQLPWTQDLLGGWGSAIYGDTLYFVGPEYVGQYEIPTMYKGTVDGGGTYISPLTMFGYSNFTIGAHNIFGQDYDGLYGIPKSTKVPTRIGALTGEGLALNYTEDTLYFVQYNSPVYRIQSFDLVNQPRAPNNPDALCVKTGYVLNDGGAGGGSFGPQHLARAHNKDIYSWVNMVGKLYVFKPN